MDFRAIAIIPARGGSKRIPRKNIKEFCGHPILYYSITAAIESKLFDEVMVSTDDAEVAQIAQSLGAKVPFLRSAGASSDVATTAEVIKEVLAEYSSILNVTFDYACCIYPTAPFITAGQIKSGLSMLLENKFQSVFPVVSFSYPILRSLKMNSQNQVEMNWPENKSARSQDLPKAFHDAGAWYWLDIEKFLETGQIFGEYSGGYELSELEVQDIDNETDWKLAELKYKLLNP